MVLQIVGGGGEGGGGRGWCLESYTKITFLPPIRNPITDYSTVLECIYQSQKLSQSSNMKYTHITVDAGAAAKFYHVIWNNPAEFHNILIHLEDFHTMMKFFCSIRKALQSKLDCA